ncbi:MAG: NEW3 domain-containing protein [bacterium]
MRAFILKFSLLLSLTWLAAPAQETAAQVNYNQRDDQYRLLGLKRAKEAYEVARAEYERQKSLFEKGLIAQVELNNARNRFADAEVNYQQSLLAVLFEKQYVSVNRAVKSQTKDGRKRVRVQLANTSGGSAEFRKLVNLDDELFRSLQPDVINDVYVSLMNDQNTIISNPYERKIEVLEFSRPVELEFELLQDLDAVTVSITYGSGTQRAPKIYLQKDSRANKVILQSEQFSQEAELGGAATFTLSLELFSGVNNTFKLEVVNLPQQITRYFTDPASQARLSQFKFTESANTRRAALQVFLPDRPSAQVIMDQPIPFYVLVIPQEQLKDFENAPTKIWTPEDIERLNAGSIRLELVPAGKGKLLVRAPQLFFTGKADRPVSFNIDVINEGTRRLDNVLVQVDPPMNWEKNIEPALVAALNIAEEKRVLITAKPPKELAAGRYEIRVRTTALSDNQPVVAEDKSFTIEIQSEANLLGITLITMLVVGLMLGIVVFGVKLSRR